MPDHQPCI